ncbi:MAG: D-2-hydroxyacid dehydrogenase [Chloroflexi bacterium]|nr:D-2-hydroxyacid dehydrogenase [Chloroflexota bacterium]
MADSETINVVVAMNFSDAIINQLREVSPRLHVERYHPTVPDKVWATADILFTSNNFPTLEQAPNLRWIQLVSAGINHAASQPILLTDNVEVTTASGIHATPMSEFSLAMMLAFAYKLPKILEFQAQVYWVPDRTTVFTPTPLRGQTLGIVGYGNIGRELARAADALGMTVLATKRDVMHPADDDSYHEAGTGDPEGEIPARLYPPQALASMARECDFLVLTTPLTEATHHLVDATVLKAMKKTAVLINVARGAVVDEAALITALQEHRIGGAALDVFEQEPLPPESPLWKLDNVILSGHISGSVVDYDERAATLFAENLQRYLDGQPLLNRVNLERGY